MLNKYFCTYTEKDDPADHLYPALENVTHFLAKIDSRETDNESYSADKRHGHKY